LSDLDYSHRTLLEKLGVKPESRVSLLGIRDAHFLREILPQVANPAQHRAAKDSDLIFLGVESEGQLKRLEPLKKYMTVSGAIWVIYPKGQKHITQAQVLSAIKAAGLTDNKVCSFSETHTALRACIPVALR
jgi:hypothetical protein